MKDKLFELLRTHRDEYSDREYQCLETLIEYGTITTFEELAEYGIVVQYLEK